MAQQVINVGSSVNSRDGDAIRTAFQKVNNNFQELYTVLTEVSYATEQYVNEVIGSIEFPDTSNFITVDNLPSTVVLEHIELTKRTESTGIIVSFEKPENTELSDEIDNNLILTRPIGVGAGLINIALEQSWDTETSPAGTLWNWDGWDNLDTVKTRNYASLRQTLKHRIGENIVGAELIMHDLTNDKYYKFKFTSWAQGPAHTGAFAYTRELVDTSYKVGIEFADGTTLVTKPKDLLELPQIFSGDTNEYILGLGDRGKHVYAFTESIIRIPSVNIANFPIGTTIYIVTGAITGQNGVRIVCTDSTTLEKEGQSGLSTVELNPYSAVIMVKIEPFKWNIAGSINLSSYALISSVPTDISQLTDNQGLLENFFDGGSASSDFDQEQIIDGGGA